MTPKDLKQIDKLLDKKFDEKLKNFATKDDLKNFTTKDDLKNFATKDDLKNFATKDEIELKIDEAVAEIIASVDKNKADKEDVEKLEVRVKKLETIIQET